MKPIIYHEQTRSIREQLDYALEFTQTFIDYSDYDVSIREAMCIDKMFPMALSDIVEGDLFAGRLIEPIVGMLPQPDIGCCYYYSKRYLPGMVTDMTLTDEDRKDAAYLLDFWQRNCTMSVIENAYTPDVSKILFTRDLSEYNAGFPLFRIAGVMMNYEKLLQKGIPGLILELENKNETPLYEGSILALKTLIKCIDYYEMQALKLLDETLDNEYKNDLESMILSLRNIKCTPPATFAEALQLLFIYWEWSGSIDFGRMDTFLADFYVNDVDNKVITDEEALRLLQGFWRLTVTRKQKFDTRITVGGKGRINEANCDRFAMLAMEATRTVKEIVPQLTLRFYNGQNPSLLEKAYQVIGEGRTFPMLYNDEVNIPSVMKSYEVDENTAIDYCPYGCGEYVIYKKCVATPSGVINMLKVLEITINNGKDFKTGKQLGLDFGNLETFKSFEELLSAFKNQVEYFVRPLAKQQEIEYIESGKHCSLLYLTILMDDCISRGKSMLAGGIEMLSGTLEAYGNTNAADSLTSIKYNIYDKKTMSARTMREALLSNFEGYETERKLMLDAPKYGNDDDYADDIYIDMHNHLCNYTKHQNQTTKLDNYLIVIINNETNSSLGTITAASSDGRRGYTFMANANSPQGGADMNGPTAVFNSMVKLATDVHAGSVQNMKFSKDMFSEHLSKTKALLQTYFLKGGAQVMISVLGREDLENALKEPENYKNLIVRVGGFSDRFVNLSKEVQRELLSRTMY